MLHLFLISPVWLQHPHMSFIQILSYVFETVQTMIYILPKWCQNQYLHDEYDE